MSNRRYYARRAARQCPQCARPVDVGVYCPTHRAAHRRRVATDRAQDRVGYNQYMRVYRTAPPRAIPMICNTYDSAVTSPAEVSMTEQQKKYSWKVGDKARYVAGPPSWRPCVGRTVTVVHVGKASDGTACATIEREDGARISITADERNTNIEPLKATLAIHATCPHCGFDINVLRDEPENGDHYDNGHDHGRGGFRTACDSCGEPFVIEAEAVHAVQAVALRLLGEA